MPAYVSLAIFGNIAVACSGVCARLLHGNMTALMIADPTMRVISSGIINGNVGKSVPS